MFKCFDDDLLRGIRKKSVENSKNFRFFVRKTFVYAIANSNAPRMCANKLHKQPLFIFCHVQVVETQFGKVIIANAQVAKGSPLSYFTIFARLTTPNLAFLHLGHGKK